MSVLKLKTAPATEPVTLTEAKRQCRLDAAFVAQDDLIDSYIKTARQYLERLVGPIIMQTWYQYEENWPAWETLCIRKQRLLTVTAVTYIDLDGDSFTFSADDYTVNIDDWRHGKIVLKPTTAWPTDGLWNINPIRIEFTCGFGAAAAVDEPIRQAILLYVESLYTGNPVPDAFDSLIVNYRY
jgi:uncharacterized phiE125 gp8 family phage protein